MEKSAIVSFWRLKDSLSVKRINDRDTLFFDGKHVLLKSEIKSKVQTGLKQTKGAGARAIAYTLKESYVGCCERNVLEILKGNKQHGELHAQFTNKAPLKSINASEVFERVQIDLINMKRQHVVKDGCTYKYILTVVDVFSRFTFLRALKSKSAKEVANSLQNIFLEHGYPAIVQCDNGPEFRGCVEKVLKEKRVKVVKGRPYHPQSQGKVERQNRSVKNKIKFDSMHKSKKGTNWVDSLSSVANALNSVPKEVLAYQTAHSVYFGRNKTLSANEIRAKANRASTRCSKRAMVYTTKQNPCTIYRKGDRVLLRYPCGKRRVPYKRHVLKGKIVKRAKMLHRYLVRYTNPEGNIRSEWISVSDITSRTLKEEQERRKRSKDDIERLTQINMHREKYYIALNNKDQDELRSCEEQLNKSDTDTGRTLTDIDTDSLFEEPGLLQDQSKYYFCRNVNVEILKNPEGTGNCQFDAVSDQLKTIGVYLTDRQLRRAAVVHIQHHIDIIILSFSGRC